MAEHVCKIDFRLFFCYKSLGLLFQKGGKYLNANEFLDQAEDVMNRYVRKNSSLVLWRDQINQTQIEKKLDRIVVGKKPDQHENPVMKVCLDVHNTASIEFYDAGHTKFWVTLKNPNLLREVERFAQMLPGI